MPDINQKLERFRQLVLEDAQQERTRILTDIEVQRTERLAQAEAEIRARVNAETQRKAETIQAETGRNISRRMMEDKRIIATRREEIGRKVFDEVRRRILDFTKTPDYLPHLKKLYLEAFDALGNPYDGLIGSARRIWTTAGNWRLVCLGGTLPFRPGALRLEG